VEALLIATLLIIGSSPTAIDNDADGDLPMEGRVRLKFRSTDGPNTSTITGGNAGANTPINMSDQNKTAGTAPSSTMNKPTPTEKMASDRSEHTRDQATPKPPSHEQGREHTPNVDARKDAADTRRNTGTSNDANEQGTTEGRTSDRKEAEAGDAKRTVAEGQESTKPGHDAVRPTGKTNTSGNR